MAGKACVCASAIALVWDSLTLFRCELMHVVVDFMVTCALCVVMKRVVGTVIATPPVVAPTTTVYLASVKFTSMDATKLCYSTTEVTSLDCTVCTNPVAADGFRDLTASESVDFWVVACDAYDHATTPLHFGNYKHSTFPRDVVGIRRLPFVTHVVVVAAATAAIVLRV